MSNRKTMLFHGAQFAEWIVDQREAERHLSIMADQLSDYLIRLVNTPDDAIHFWNAVVPTRKCCNEPTTYDLPFAADAYACNHLLQRYWRTWQVLLHLTQHGVLPLGKYGVRVLDVGSGPGPTPYAIQDFYQALRTYGAEREIDHFRDQTTEMSVVENSVNMNRFMHHFSESTGRPGPFGAYRLDLSDVDPPGERLDLRLFLRNKEYRDGDDFYPEYSLDEVNEMASSHQRFRFVVFSNFLTTSETVSAFEVVLKNLFGDLRSGAVVLLLGGRSESYQKIYHQIEGIVKDSGLRVLEGPSNVLGEERNQQALKIEVAAQKRLYQHLVQLAGQAAIPVSEPYPNFSDVDAGIKDKLTMFNLTVYRKGRWPRPASKQSNPSEVD